MKRMLALMLGAVILMGVLCACGHKQQEAEIYDLYFRETELENAVGRDALSTAQIILEDTDQSTQELAEILMQRLLEGPEDSSLKNTIPNGTKLISLDVQDGRAIVNLSSTYGMLSGIGLTMADYAITLTLTQLVDISSVKINVRGQGLAYREKQVFQSRDVLLSPQADVVGSVETLLYYLDMDGKLIPEERVLDLYEGDTQITAVMRALEQGPESPELQPLFPEGFRVQSLWLEEDVCYVNLSSALMNYLPDDKEAAGLVIEGISRSLFSLESVSEVQYLVDGEFFQTYQGIQIGQAFLGF